MGNTVTIGKQLFIEMIDERWNSKGNKTSTIHKVLYLNGLGFSEKEIKEILYK